MDAKDSASKGLKEVRSRVKNLCHLGGHGSHHSRLGRRVTIKEASSEGSGGKGERAVGNWRKGVFAAGVASSAAAPGPPAV